MQCIQILANGRIETTTDPVTSCPGYVVLHASDAAAVTSNVVVQSSEVAYVFSWGFGVVLFFWSLGFAIGAAKRAIKLL